MANIKSAKKRVITNENRRQRNVARRSEVKTAVRKVTDALSSGEVDTARTLLRVAESKIARAGQRSTLSKAAASRKISRLAQKVDKATRPAS